MVESLLGVPSATLGIVKDIHPYFSGCGEDKQSLLLALSRLMVNDSLLYLQS